VFDHVGTIVVESCHDHLLAEVVDDRSEDQGTGNVDPEILTDDNQLVYSMEFLDVGNHHVYRMVLATVDKVFLATGNLGPVIRIYHSLVASGIHGCLYPWVETICCSDPESLNKLRKIAPPMGQVTEPWIPGELDPAAGD